MRVAGASDHTGNEAVPEAFAAGGTRACRFLQAIGAERVAAGGAWFGSIRRNQRSSRWRPCWDRETGFLGGPARGVRDGVSGTTQRQVRSRRQYVWGAASYATTPRDASASRVHARGSGSGLGYKAHGSWRRYSIWNRVHQRDPHCPRGFGRPDSCEILLCSGKPWRLWWFVGCPTMQRSPLVATRGAAAPYHPRWLAGSGSSGTCACFPRPPRHRSRRHSPASLV